MRPSSVTSRMPPSPILLSAFHRATSAIYPSFACPARNYGLVVVLEVLFGQLTVAVSLQSYVNSAFPKLSTSRRRTLNQCEQSGWRYAALGVLASTCSAHRNSVLAFRSTLGSYATTYTNTTHDAIDGYHAAWRERPQLS